VVAAAGAVTVAAGAGAVAVAMTTTSGRTSGQCSRDHLEQVTCNVL